MSPLHKWLLFYVYREHVLGVVNLLNSPGRMWPEATILFLFGGTSHALVEWFRC